MEGHTFLSFNIPNVITVWIIVVLGVVILKFGSSVYNKQKSGG